MESRRRKPIKALITKNLNKRISKIFKDSKYILKRKKNSFKGFRIKKNDSYLFKNKDFISKTQRDTRSSLPPMEKSRLTSRTRYNGTYSGFWKGNKKILTKSNSTLDLLKRKFKSPKKKKMPKKSIEEEAKKIIAKLQFDLSCLKETGVRAPRKRVFLKEDDVFEDDQFFLNKMASKKRKKEKMIRKIQMNVRKRCSWFVGSSELREKKIRLYRMNPFKEERNEHKLSSFNH